MVDSDFQEDLVSAVVTTYNSAAYIVEAVESVLEQDYGPIEVIVVDDGSTDDTADRLALYRDQIRHIRQTNGGPSKARNRGIRDARGEFIAFLDGDDVWLPTKIRRQVEFMHEHPTVGLVHSDVYQYRQGTREIVLRLNPRRKEYSGNCYTRFFWGHPIGPTTALVRKGCFDRVGMFDESIRGPSFEDQEMWMRLSRAFPFGFIDEPLAVYRVHESNGSHNVTRNLEDNYRVLIKALREDPELMDQLGKREAREKLWSLAFGAGYALLDADEGSKARRYLSEALLLRPWKATPAIYWGLSLLPAASRRGMRSVKQGIQRMLGRARAEEAEPADGPGGPVIERRRADSPMFWK